MHQAHPRSWSEPNRLRSRLRATAVVDSGALPDARKAKLGRHQPVEARSDAVEPPGLSRAY